MKKFENTVLTYGLEAEETERLNIKHRDFAFEDVSDCFTDILALNAIAVIINPEKLSSDEFEQLVEVYCRGDVEYNEISNIAASDGKKYVVLDIETTGLSPTTDKITEMGAVKIENGAIVAEFNQLINPGIGIPTRIAELTGITSEMVADMPTIEKALPPFLEFCADSTIIAHNAGFDMGFIKHNAEKLGLGCDFEIMDTLEIARRMFPDLENHKLDTVANYLGVELFEHHRAAGDALAAAKIFLRCREMTVQ